MAPAALPSRLTPSRVPLPLSVTSRPATPPRVVAPPSPRANQSLPASSLIGSSVLPAPIAIGAVLPQPKTVTFTPSPQVFVSATPVKAVAPPSPVRLPTDLVVPPPAIATASISLPSTGIIVPPSLPVSVPPPMIPRVPDVLPSPTYRGIPLPSPPRALPMASQYSEAVAMNIASTLSSRGYHMSGIVHLTVNGAPQTLMVQTYTPLGDVAYVLTDSSGTALVVPGLNVTMVKLSHYEDTLISGYTDYLKHGVENGCGAVILDQHGFHTIPFEGVSERYTVQGAVISESSCYPLVRMSEVLADPVGTSGRIRDTAIEFDYLAITGEQKRLGNSVIGLEEIFHRAHRLYVNIARVHNACGEETKAWHKRYSTLFSAKKSRGLSPDEDAEMRAIGERLRLLTDTKMRYIHASRLIAHTIEEHKDALFAQTTLAASQLYVAANRDLMGCYEFKHPSCWDLPQELGDIDFISSRPGTVVTLSGAPYTGSIPTSVAQAL